MSPHPKQWGTFPLDLGPCLSRLNAFNVYRHNALTKEGAVRGGVSFDFVRKPATSVSDRCVHGCTSSVHPWHSPCRRTTDRSGCPAAWHFTARWSPRAIDDAYCCNTGLQFCQSAWRGQINLEKNDLHRPHSSPAPLPSHS